MMTAAIKRCLLLGKAMTNLDCIKKQNKASYSQSCGFSSGHVWMWAGPSTRLSAQELMPLNCGAGEDSRVPWTARQSNQSILKENQPWIFIGRTDAKVEAPTFWPLDSETTHWKRPWCWERVRAGREGDDREDEMAK